MISGKRRFECFLLNNSSNLSRKKKPSSSSAQEYLLQQPAIRMPPGKAYLKWALNVVSGLDLQGPRRAGRRSCSSLLAIGDIEDLLLIAEQVRRRLTGGELVSWLQDWSAGLQTKNENVIRGLSNLDIPIMTTNYDTIIEDVTHRKSVSLEEADYEEMIKAQDNYHDYVIHLHGCYKKPENIVFGIRSYDRFIEDEFKSFFMKLFPAFRSVIFVGCGAGLSDPNFSALKEWIKKNRQGVSIRHYRLLAKEEDNDIQPEARIVPLVYGEKYADLERFLSELTG